MESKEVTVAVGKDSAVQIRQPHKRTAPRPQAVLLKIVSHATSTLSKRRPTGALCSTLFLGVLTALLVCLLVIVAIVLAKSNKDAQQLNKAYDALSNQLSAVADQLNNLPTAAPRSPDVNAPLGLSLLEASPIQPNLADPSWFAEQLNQIKEMLQSSKKVQLGVLLPLTGDAAYIGVGLKVAIEEAIKDASSDWSVELEMRDTQGNAYVAEQQYRELYQQGVRLFVGPVTSSEVIRVAQASQRDDVLFVSPSATADQLRDYDNVICLSPEDSRLVDALMQQLQRLNMTQAVVFYRTDAYGLSMVQAISMRNQYQQTPINLFFMPYDATAAITGNATFVNGVKQLMAQLAATPYTSVIAIARTEINELLRLSEPIAALLNAAWFAPDSVALGTDVVDDAAALVAQAVLLTGFSYAGDGLNAYNRVRQVDDIRTALGDTPSFQSILAYDAVTMLLQAVRQFPTPSSRLLAQRIRDSTSLTGLSGQLTFDQFGFRSQGAYAVLTYLPTSYPRLVQLPTDGPWILQGFYGFGTTNESLLNAVAGADVLHKESLLQLAQSRSIDCSTGQLKVRLRDTISHELLERSFDVATMPDTLVVQASFGWEADATCSGANGTFAFQIGCSGFDLAAQRRCFASTAQTGRPNRQLLQTVSKTICATVSPLCSVIKSIVTTAPMASTNNQAIATITVGAICDSSTLVCNIANQLNTAGLINSVICSELYRQKRLALDLLLADHRFGSDLALQDAHTYAGYRLLAGPVVELMQHSEAVSGVVARVAVPWAQQMAYETGDAQVGHWLGRVLLRFAVPVVRVVGLAYAYFDAVCLAALVAVCTAALLYDLHK